MGKSKKGTDTKSSGSGCCAISFVLVSAVLVAIVAYAAVNMEQKG